jgi:hypothetical protein
MSSVLAHRWEKRRHPWGGIRLSMSYFPSFAIPKPGASVGLKRKFKIHGRIAILWPHPLSLVLSHSLATTPGSCRSETSAGVGCLPCPSSQRSVHCSEVPVVPCPSPRNTWVSIRQYKMNVLADILRLFVLQAVLFLIFRHSTSPFIRFRRSALVHSFKPSSRSFI